MEFLRKFLFLCDECSGYHSIKPHRSFKSLIEWAAAGGCKIYCSKLNEDVTKKQICGGESDKGLHVAEGVAG